MGVGVIRRVDDRGSVVGSAASGFPVPKAGRVQTWRARRVVPIYGGGGGRMLVMLMLRLGVRRGVVAERVCRWRMASMGGERVVRRRSFVGLGDGDDDSTIGDGGNGVRMWRRGWVEGRCTWAVLEWESEIEFCVVGDGKLTFCLSEDVGTSFLGCSCSTCQMHGMPLFEFSMRLLGFLCPADEEDE